MSFASGRLRETARKYGTTAVGTYLAVHTTAFLSVYAALESGLDVRGYLQRVGLLAEPTVADREALNEDRKWYDSLLAGRGRSLALAFLCSKALIPVKIPLAVTLTPLVHRTLRRFGVVRNKV